MILRAIIATVHPGWALTLSLAVAPQPGPSSPAPSDLLSELATKVAAIVGATTPPPNIAIGCSSNLRERVCTAEIGSGAGREVVIVTRPHEQVQLETTATIPTVVQPRPIIAQAEQILDAAMVGRRLLVLDAAAVTLHDASADGWQRVASVPLEPGSPWPRDLRGRLLVAGAAWEAHLPGTVCRGLLDPLRGTCTREQAPWPLGIENTGMPPGRNDFTMANGQKYFSVAPLDQDAGARWMMAAEGGTPIFLDEQRVPLEAPLGVADDVAAIATACAPGSTVAVASHPPDGGTDIVRVVRVVKRQLEDVASPLRMSGRVTALWTTLAGDGALAVTRNPSTRGYEAVHIVLSCGR
jgi:hypothetical protein